MVLYDDVGLFICLARPATRWNTRCFHYICCPTRGVTLPTLQICVYVVICTFTVRLLPFAVQRCFPRCTFTYVYAPRIAAFTPSRLRRAHVRCYANSVGR